MLNQAWSGYMCHFYHIRSTLATDRAPYKHASCTISELSYSESDSCPSLCTRRVFRRWFRVSSAHRTAHMLTYAMVAHTSAMSMLGSGRHCYEYHHLVVSLWPTMYYGSWIIIIITTMDSDMSRTRANVTKHLINYELTDLRPPCLCLLVWLVASPCMFDLPFLVFVAYK